MARRPTSSSTRCARTRESAAVAALLDGAPLSSCSAWLRRCVCVWAAVASTHWRTRCFTARVLAVLPTLPNTRWKNHLDPNISKKPWTPEEDSLVEALRHKYGNQWKKIAFEVPGR